MMAMIFVGIKEFREGKAGFGNPYDLTFSVTVTNKSLSISFSSQINKATLSGIQIIPQ